MKKVSADKLRQILLPLSIAVALLISVMSQACANHIGFVKPDSPSIEGRWDITINESGKNIPSWLEVQRSGNHTLVGRFVYAFGSARPISQIKVNDKKFSFSIPPQWEKGDNDMQFEFTQIGDSLSGTMIYTDGKMYSWTAARAPLLQRLTKPIWGAPVQLFGGGTGLRGWHALGENQWVAESGILRSPHSGSNLVTDKTYSDFKLHIEFRYPKGSNSGIYLRGRYEVQIEDARGGETEPINNVFSAIYGFLPPGKMVAKNAGEWQSFDITLIGRMVTVIANGTTVICNQEIPGITGGAIDSREGEPGPLLIQGDHGPVDFRNIIITTAK